MALPEPLQSTQTQQPGTLKNPVPNPPAQDLPDLGALAVELGGFEDPNADADSGDVGKGGLPEQRGGLPDLGAMAQGMEGAPVPTLSIQGGDPSMSPMQPPEGMASLGEQLREAGARFRNAWTTTNEESVGVLKRSGLFEDVRIKNDKVQVKRPGREGFENFDREKAELIGDTIDLARMVFEGGVEFGAEALGTAGLVAAAPKTMGGSVLAQPAVGAGAALTAMNAGDFVAEKIVGVERDPERSRLTEGSIAAGFGAGFGWWSASAARKAAMATIKREGAQKTLEGAKKQLADVNQMIRDVQESGIKLDVGKGEFRLDPNQITRGEIPELKVQAAELSKKPAVRKFYEEQGEALKQGFDSLASGIKATAGESEALGKDFVLSAKDIRKVEGTLLESYRKLADEKLAKQPQSAIRTVRAMNDILQELGGSFTPQGARLPTPESVMEALPGVNKTQARALLANMDNVVSKLKASNGMLNVDDTRKLYDTLRTRIDNSINTSNGRPLALQLVKIKDAIRDDWGEMIMNVLPEGQKGAYAKSMARYSEVASSWKTMTNLLKTEDISRNALVGKLFEGKNSLKFAKSARNLIQESDPALWSELTAEYFSKLKMDNMDVATGNVNWTAMAKKWRNLGPEMQDVILKGSGYEKKAINSLMNIGAIYNKTSFEALPTERKVGIARNLFVLLGNTLATSKGDAATNILSGIGSDEAMMRWLKEGGLEATLKKTPSLNPAKANGLRQWISDWTPKGTRQALSTGARRDIIDE